MDFTMVIQFCFTFITYVNLAKGLPIQTETDVEDKTTNLTSYHVSDGAEVVHQQQSLSETSGLNPLSFGYPRINTGLSPHAIKKRQATKLAINSHSPPENSDGSISVGVAHALGGGAGGGSDTSFGGQLGFGTNGDATWGLNVGHDTGSTNFGANLGGTFGGGTQWGANIGGSFGEGLDWSGTAGGAVGGDTEWGANLDKTWQHDGGSSSSLGAWIKGDGNGAPAAGLKYVLNIE